MNNIKYLGWGIVPDFVLEMPLDKKSMVLFRTAGEKGGCYIKISKIIQFSWNAF